MWMVLEIFIQSIILLIGYEMSLMPGLLKTSKNNFIGMGLVDKLVIFVSNASLDFQDNSTAWGNWQGEGQFEDLFSGTHQHPLGFGHQPDNVFLQTNCNYYFGKNPSPLTRQGLWISNTGNKDFPEILHDFAMNNSCNKAIILIQLNDIFLDEPVHSKNMSAVKGKVGKIFKNYNRTGFMLLTNAQQIVLWGQGAGNGKQENIHQEDVAPLIATLLGVAVPKESRGSLSLAYINSSDEIVGKSLAENGLHLAMICLATSNFFRDGLLFRQFMRLSLKHCAFEDYRNEIINYQLQNDFKGMKTFSWDIICNSNECIEQFKSFYKIMFLIIAYFSIIPWCIILLSLVKVEETYAPQWYFLSGILHFSFTLLALGTSYMVLYTQWPYYFVFYFTFPVLLWWVVLLMHEKWTSYLQRYNLYLMFCLFIIILISVELIYWSWIYNYLAALFVLPYCFYLAFSQSLHVPYYITTLWLGSTPMLLAFFQVSHQPSLTGITIASCLWFIVGILIIYYTRKDHFALTSAASFILLLLLAHFITHLFFQRNNSVPLDWLRSVSWWLLLVPVLAFFGSNNLPSRLLLLGLASAVPFLILSQGFELLFFLFFCFNLYSWMELEISARQYPDQGLVGGLCIYFFGFVGNALSSIKPNYELFLHSNNDIISSMLFHFKTFLPILLVSCSSAALCNARGIPIQNPQLTTLVLSAHNSVRQLLGILHQTTNLNNIIMSFAFTVKLVIAFSITRFIVRTSGNEHNQINKTSKTS